MSQSRRLDPDVTILVAVYVAVALVAAFAFLQSYEHIYDLARSHGQPGLGAKLLPLSVDLLIVAATLVLVLQKRRGEELTTLALILPRLMLWSGIAATVAANVTYGLPDGPIGATLAAWPGYVFAGMVETVMVAVRPASREVVKRTVIPAGQPLVPATVMEAARAAFDASAAAGNPLSGYQLHKRFSIPRSQADKICKNVAGAVTAEKGLPRPPAMSVNGDSSHG